MAYSSAFGLAHIITVALASAVIIVDHHKVQMSMLLNITLPVPHYNHIRGISLLPALPASNSELSCLENGLIERMARVVLVRFY